MNSLIKVTASALNSTKIIWISKRVDESIFNQLFFNIRYYARGNEMCLSI